MKHKACIVLPTYNEAGNISSTIKKIFEQQKEIETYDLHVVVIDDNSPDGTSDIVQKLQGKYPKLDMITGSNSGLGGAYKAGIKYAIETLKAKLIFQMDSDGQHDPALIPLFVTLAEHGFSLIIGSRYTQGGQVPHYTLYRKLLSILGNWMIRLIGGLYKIRDCSSGFRCIKAELLEKVNIDQLSSKGYSFQACLLYGLVNNDANVIEVPITFIDRKFGSNKISLNDQCDFIINLAKIRLKQSEEFIKFCFVGASGVVVNLGFYILFSRAFNMLEEVAYPLAIEISIITNFLLNNYWSFKKRETQSHFINKLLKFHVVSGIAGVINFLVFWLGIRYFGLYDIISSCIGIVFATLINYILNSFWTWPKKQNL